MKRSLTLAVVGFLALVVLVMVGSAFSGANTMGKYTKTMSDVTTIGLLAELYKGDHGKYPQSLVELASQLKPDDKIRFDKAVSNWSRGFVYEPSSNGFTVVARGFRFDYQPRSNGYDVIGKFSTNEVRFGAK